MSAHDASVIICAYTEARWGDLLAAVESVQRQTVAPREIIVVVDHNQQLLERTQARIPGVVAVENKEAQGLSGARNSGIAVAQGKVIVFLDDDAIASPEWLERLTAGYAEPKVVGVGGAIVPLWLSGRPKWFPDEFAWVVGCTYKGMPRTTASIRNMIGANMSLRHDVFDNVGGFRSGIGRVGTRPVGCEETELCIRVRQHDATNVILYEPSALVQHRVPANRAGWWYFCSRCYAEGLSKALITNLVGTQDGLASERTYTLKVLPQGVIRGLGTGMRGDTSGLACAAAIVAGLVLTTAGYIIGMASQRLARLRGQTTDVQISRSLPSPQNDAQSPGSSWPDYEKKDGGTGVTFVGDVDHSTPELTNFRPARVLEVEIGQQLHDIPSFDEATGRFYQHAMALVRLHSHPLGVVELELPQQGLTADACAQQIWQALQVEINTHQSQDGLNEPSELAAAGLLATDLPKCVYERDIFLANAPFVSIIVATRNRPDSLSTTLDLLLALSYPNYEIIVVDNAPSTDATAALLRQKYGNARQIRYIRETRPGLACAHNRGLMEAQAEIVAFTDDDVVVDRYWLAELVKGFQAAEHVACVTGMILPAELETPAQMWIEQFGGYNKGFQRLIFDRAENRRKTPLYPYTAGVFGSGANMAFRTSVLREVGGFDSALGAGSLALGADDLAAFFEVIAAGYAIVYEPAAIVYHWHRREYAGLRRLMYGYGVGLTAYLTKCLVDRPQRLVDIAGRIPSGLAYVLSPQSPKNIKKVRGYPRELTQIEWKGMLYGPIAYLRSRWHIRNYERAVWQQHIRQG